MCQLHDTFLWPRTSSSVPALGISHNLLHRHTPACWNPVGTKSYKTKALRNIVHMSVNLLTPCQDKSSSPAHTHTAIGSVPNNLTLSLPASLRHQLSSGTASLSTSCLLSPRPALMSPRLFAVALMMATLVLTLSSAQGTHPPGLTGNRKLLQLGSVNHDLPVGLLPTDATASLLGVTLPSTVLGGAVRGLRQALEGVAGVSNTGIVQPSSTNTLFFNRNFNDG